MHSHKCVSYLKQRPLSSVLRKILKIIGWILAGIIFLFVLILILIQLPPVQNFAKNKIVSFLENKIKTKVSIGKLDIDFPKRIVLKNVYFEDQQKDTLLAGKELRVDIALFKLLRNEVNVNYLELNGITAHVYRVLPDTVFNFEYILKAFASEQKKQPQPEDTTSALKFHLDQIVLKNILTTFKDDDSGNDVYFSLGNFNTRINKFDPTHQIYDIKEINLSDIDARIYQYKPLVKNLADTTTTTAASPSTYPHLNLNSLDMKNIRFNYKNDISALFTDLNIGEFNTHPANINLQSLFVQLKDIGLKNSSATIVMGKTEQAKAVKKVVANETAKQLSNPWKIELGKVDFANNEIRFDDNNKPKEKSGMDFMHMHVQTLTVQADSLTFSPTSYKGNIARISFKEQSGFDLQKLQTRFAYSDSAAHLEKLLIQTDKTLIKDRLVIKYPSIEKISKQPGELFIDADIKNSSIAAKDIFIFMPTLRSTLKVNDQAVFHLNTVVKGLVKDLSIPAFEFSGLSNTVAKLSGNIKGLPDVKNTYYNINIAQLSSSKNDLLALIPPSSLPASLRLPEKLNVKGFFKGTMKSFNTHTAIETNRGNLDLTGGMKPGDVYDLKLSMENVQAGYLLSQEKNIGNISLNASVNGAGMDMKKSDIRYVIAVKSAIIKGYDYKGFAVQGDLKNGLVHAIASMEDPNIAFNVDAKADIKSRYPAVQLDLLLDTINLNSLNLTKDTISLHAHFTADMPVANPDSLNGTALIRDIHFSQSEKHYSADSIALNAKANGTDKAILLQSDFIKASMKGQYKLTEIGTALQQTINKYYNIKGLKEQSFAAQNWKLDAVIKPRGLLLNLAPGLKGTDSVTMHTSFNSTNNDLNASIKSHRIILDKNQLDSLNMTVSTNKDHLDWNLSFQDARASGLRLYHTALGGFLAANKLDFGLEIKDKKNKPQYALGGLINLLDSGITFSLKPANFLLNYDLWTVAPDNFIQYDSSGVLIKDFALKFKEQSLLINSETQQLNAPVKAEFKNFNISTLTKIANQDSLLIDGIIDGNAVVKDVTKNPVFTSDLQIKNVVYKLDTIGNVFIKVNNEQANSFAANVKIEGNNNDIRLAGHYFTGEGKMDLKLDLNQVNLAIVKPFATGQLTDISGLLKGNMAITGTMKQPAVNGELNFQNALIVPTITGEPVKLSNETIKITPAGIHFDQFTLRDSANDEAIIDGDIFTKDFKDYKFNVDLNANNFRLVNSVKTTNQLFYGKLNIDADIKMRGDLNAPTAQANLRINKQTDFTLILPSNNPEVESRKGVVRFINKNHPMDSAQMKTILDSLSNKSALRGIDVSANIETDSSAMFTMIIDERSGDALTLKGRADLNGGIDKSGKMSLTGNYELTSGSYQLSLSFMKRKFDIQRGSTITWTGDPTSANINVTATYLANTPSIDLVEPQLAGRSQAEINRYKEKLPFLVNLKMQNELLKPAISFDITLPEHVLSQWPDVDTKLQQIRNDPSELNKQVFALLLLNRFVGENPLQSSAGGAGLEGTLRQSASSILTDQLNQLAGNLIQGVDLNFGINSQQDYSTGQAANRTDLNVGVSKKLMNDRLRVNVGSNFELEGPQSSNRSASNIAGDVSVDYQLSKDGRYMLRAYRKNQYEGVVEGQVIETGVSFILTYDYNKLKELFEGVKQERKRRKQIRKEKKELKTEKQ